MTTSIKTCFKCGERKPLSEFYRHNMMADGRLNKCKSCTRSDTAKNRRARLDYYRAYDRQRGNRQSYVYTKMYRSHNRHKHKAHSSVGNALRSGKIAKLDACEYCGNPDNIVGHHASYALPLCVTWLCQGCHVTLHRQHERILKE